MRTVSVAACAACLAVISAAPGLAAPPWGGASPIALGRTISASAPLPASAFGRSIAIVGDAIGVGCVTTGPLGASSEGWVEIWTRHDDLGVAGWVPVQRLAPFGRPLGEAGGDGAFGAAVVGDDEWLFVAQPYAAVRDALDAGVVHAFRRDSGGSWQFVEALGVAAPLADRRFGRALAFDGATLAIGSAGAVQLVPVTSAGVGAAITLAPPAIDGVVLGDWGTAVAIDGERLRVAGTGASDAGVVTAFDVATATPPSFEGFVETPNGLAPGDRFGAALAVSGHRLAVAAPGSDKGGDDAGTVFVYDRAAASWAFQTEILGTQSGEALGAVAFDGDVVAIGSPTLDDPGTAAVDGGAWLYRVSGRIPELLAQAAPTDLGALDSRAGGAVALANGRWAHSLVRGPSSFAIGGVRVADVTDIGADCDGDGIADGANVTVLGAPDCDANLVPDECDLATHDCDGNAEIDACETALVRSAVTEAVPGTAGWGLVGAPEIAVLFLVALEVPSESDGILRGVDADWYAPTSTQPAFVAVYDDPDQDGDPSDATLRAIVGISPAAGYGIDRVRLAPLALGPSGTRYFVGLGVKGVTSAATSSFVRSVGAAPGTPRTYTVVGNAESIDVETPGSSPTLAPLAGGAANVWCAGLFRAAIDANVNGVPDACECNGDLDGNGTIGPPDLAILLGAWGFPGADLDGDATVGPNDLAILLGAWGPC
ncbi:MAG: FG-GAP repeat protein [Phycisphaerae bacterium]|nr:FG-GAP repeat protein [Phycisphaerae bacterium]